MPSFEHSPAPFRVLILGGSYAGLAAALNLVDLCHGRRHRFSITDGDNGTGKVIPVQVTIVDPRDGWFHLIGQPLALASTESAEAFWCKYSETPALQTPNIRTLQGTIDSLDCTSKRATIATSKGPIQESYDYLITCTGLRREFPSAPRSVTREDYLAESAQNLANVRDAPKGVAIIGGGAVGIEIAAECKMLHPHTDVTLIHSRASLLSSEPLPAEFSAKALEIIRASGINTVMGARVNETTKTDDGYTLTLSTGETLTASHVINAVSRFTPTAPNYLPEGICDEEGYIRIKPTLEFPSDASLPAEIAADHYAAGDVARWSGIKRGGAAMHQGHYAARNIHQKMMAKVYGTTAEFVALEEVQSGMGIALGETAVSYFPSMGLGEGEETRKMFFEDDLGFMICYRWMQLGKPMPPPVEAPASEETTKPVAVSNPTPVEAAA
ncbi:hypothetical protein ASPVEDRAFT_872200 [Aspergillus versicolor CBS 583.65]|uniref:FAD/NAD(P)-binding domain-containing protein n=1 Tax=Aspergillus versicolor CBS 583.65 TaxID=1036611 RepID=A0A1L9P4V9_ASPVE|nr:uncharacterized protein ASPVEDRAFT_872200 [Aspergillus versicolor CBS 583.65]OJI96453.1 hypothetical protein ASPVEDRAFT_872200 [Aspergillus versicolor CBS 583.65]